MYRSIVFSLPRYAKKFQTLVYSNVFLLHLGGFVNVDQMGIDKWELTKWEVDQMGIDKVGIDKVGIDKVGIDEVVRYCSLH